VTGHSYTECNAFSRVPPYLLLTCRCESMCCPSCALVWSNRRQL